MSDTLILTPNIDGADDFYADLLTAHEGRDKADSDAFNARLLLVLANHIGDRTILKQALAAAALTKEEDPA
ncbi:MAG: hypothetical protein BM560_18450 [Roseobacter sp. MedPE-SWde]|uniref:DUF2783 domain-containing protein n=1 Tax=Roseobacter sp. MED193 TaxID=314262 RepID=UPI000068A63D|nr:DUF2783 domain-containing protein [Roseobacter sp. MED193]EAQ43385.1 hypothetical protein MED193_11384 [Roseobacter sp. MED193]OIQ38634.1 MAG: hypothetical protein BM560_18450 [Roseobacter sp. MedPE-SWde]